MGGHDSPNIVHRLQAKKNADRNTPMNPDVKEIPMAVPAELEDPVAEAPEPDLVVEAREPDPEALPAVAEAEGVIVPLTPMLARSVYNDADV